MEVKSIDAVPAQDGSEQYFSGRVQIRPLFSASEPARMSCGCVTFDPCARSAWHTHPLGQTLIVMSGRGFVQSWGGSVREIRAGDVIWTPPGEKHWHGAAPDSSMTHIAIQEALDGKNVDWMEKVTDDEYRKVKQGATYQGSRF
ncbi:MAG TPA: cupin domain-containing protein [Casimicrobiaceae bacterium]|nr:cupin domain-containing protein [Casimicrobiaceae bacterium]